MFSNISPVAVMNSFSTLLCLTTRSNMNDDQSESDLKQKKNNVSYLVNVALIVFVTDFRLRESRDINMLRFLYISAPKAARRFDAKPNVSRANYSSTSVRVLHFFLPVIIFKLPRAEKQA